MHCNRRLAGPSPEHTCPWSNWAFAALVTSSIFVITMLVFTPARAASSTDAYTANTSSAKASLSSIATQDTTATRILIVGDSISAEYGLKRGSGWVALLSQRIAQQRIAASIINASISGDTTAGGRSRLASLLRKHKPGLVVIELGANDALRGLPLNMTQANLTTMVNVSQTSGAKVLLLGMQVPPNYGQFYTEEFANVFANTAQSMGVSLVPFFLNNVANAADAPRLFQADRIHPNELAQPIMLNNMWPALIRELAR